MDKTTGNEATFPSTPVNQHAVSVESCGQSLLSFRGAGTAQWLERRIRDRKVSGSSPRQERG